MSRTYTYAVLEVSARTYSEIYDKLAENGYQQAFHEDNEHGVVIDMRGIALAQGPGDDGRGDG